MFHPHFLTCFQRALCAVNHLDHCYEKELDNNKAKIFLYPILKITLETYLSWWLWFWRSQAKKGLYTTLYDFFCITHVYQISTCTSLYTRIGNFSHFCDFHIPFVYQNSHILTTYQNFWHIPAVYQSVKTSFFIFCYGQTFSWRYFSCFLDTSADIPSTWSLIYTESIQMEVNSMKIFHVKSRGHL